MKDKQVEKARLMFEKAKQDQAKVVVSTLVLLEVLEVIRKRTIENSQFSDMKPETIEQMKTLAMNRCQNFIEKVSKLAFQGRAVIIDPDTTLSKHYTRTLTAFRPYFGVVQVFGKKDPGTDKVTPKYEYKGLGQYDIQHALNALGTSACAIGSFDKPFSDIKRIEELKALNVIIM